MHGDGVVGDDDGVDDGGTGVNVDVVQLANVQYLGVGRCGLPDPFRRAEGHIFGNPQPAPFSGRDFSKAGFQTGSNPPRFSGRDKKRVFNPGFGAFFQYFIQYFFQYFFSIFSVFSIFFLFSIFVQ